MPRFTARLGVCALSALLCGTALAGTPDSSAATLGQTVDAGIKDAQAKRAARDFGGAVRILSQLMLVAPDDSRVVGEYGKVLVQQGRSKEALDFLNRAVQLQQTDWTLFSALGVAFDEAGDYANARRAYDHALTLKPGETSVLNNYAMSRTQAGDLAGAKKLIADAATQSDDPRVMRNFKMINALTPPAVAAAPAVAPAPAPVAVKPQPLTPPKLATPAVAATTPTALGHTTVQGAQGPVMIQALPAKPATIAATPPKPATLAATAPKPAPVAKPKPRTAVASPVAAPAKKPAATADIPALRLANDRP